MKLEYKQMKNFNEKEKTKENKNDTNDMNRKE